MRLRFDAEIEGATEIRVLKLSLAALKLTDLLHLLTCGELINSIQ